MSSLSSALKSVASHAWASWPLLGTACIVDDLESPSSHESVKIDGWGLLAKEASTEITCGSDECCEPATSLFRKLISRREVSVHKKNLRTLRRRRALFAMFDSGMASVLIFLAAMLCYDAALWIGWSSTSAAQPHGLGVTCSWLNLMGPVLFMVEAVIDVIWSLRARKVAADESELKRTEKSVAIVDHRATGLASPLLDHVEGETVSDAVDWDLWGAVFFFIPSVCAVLQSFGDPNIAGLGSVELVSFWGWSSVSLYVVDALICMCSRWQRMASVPQWQRPGCPFSWGSVDWCALGDAFFLLGAFCDLYDQLWSSQIALAVSDVLWTLDAIFYILGYLPATRIGLPNGNPLLAVERGAANGGG